MTRFYLTVFFILLWFSFIGFWQAALVPVSYTHLTLPTTPYV